MRAAGLALPQARIQSYSMLAIPAVVATSEMVGFLPTSMFASGAMSAGLQRLPLNFDWIASPLGVLTQRDQQIRDRLQSLLGLLRSVAASARGATGSR
jgi:DNA-binding transcriptional LysR family regulator